MTQDIRDRLPPGLEDNPFFDFSATTHFVPAWDRITSEDFLPALDFLLATAREDIEAIRDNPKRPSFRNTVEAMNDAMEMIEYVFLAYLNIVPESKAAEAEFDRTFEDGAARYTDFFLDIFTDKALFDRFKTVAGQPQFKNLGKERHFLMDMYWNSFIDSGAEQSESRIEEIKTLSRDLMQLELKAQKNMKFAAQRNPVIVRDKPRLAGLSDYMIEAAARRAREAGESNAWALSLEKETYESVMAALDDRALRYRLWRAYHSQNQSRHYDNRALIVRINNLRQRLAKKSGYRNFARMTLQYETARKPARVAQFLRKLKNKALPVAREERATLAAYAKECDGLRTLHPWDVPYYQDKLRRDTLGFGNEDLRPYFELETVLESTFSHFKKLYGLHFEETGDYPVYSDDVRAFNVTKASTGAHMGVLFLDLYERPGKSAGIAWSMNVLPEGRFMGEVRRPVDMVVCKFNRPDGDTPSLLSHYEVQTFMHEMGHAAHNLLSQARYPAFSGTSVATDFVEFPSQIQENWGYEPEVLASMAQHFETGEPLPEDMLHKIKDSRKFMAGHAVMNKVMQGRLDLSWAQAEPGRISAIRDFERAALRGYEIEPGETRDLCYSPWFSYGFGGGYESCFYGYQWAQAMEAEVYSFFKKDGLYNRRHAGGLRKILEAGGTREATRLFRSFTSRSVRLSKFFRREGLLSERFNYDAANDNAADDLGLEDVEESEFHSWTIKPKTPRTLLRRSAPRL